MTILFLCILLALAAYAAFARHRHVRLRADCVAAFTRTYASTSPPPAFEMAYSYGVPVFEVHFASQADRSAAVAAGTNDAFLRAIGGVCRHRGSKRQPFDAKRAVFFNCPPEEASDEPEPVAHCCARMKSELAEHPDRLVVHPMRSGEYGLRTHDAGGIVAIAFCPWCGSDLRGDAVPQTKSRAL